MSEGQDDDADKSHEPTQKRLDDARKRGEIARSQDLTAAAVYGGLLLALLVSGARAVEGIGSLGAGLLGRADSYAPQMLGGGTAVAADLMQGVLWAVAPLFLLPIAGALLSFTLQRAWIATPENLLPKLSRISPLAALGKKFGLDGLIEFGKSTLKALLISALLAFFLWGRIDEILGAVRLSAPGVTQVLFGQITDLLALVVVIATLFGALDYLWQKLRHTARNRMSRKEMTDEHKESEGDPHVKSQRRQRAQEIAMNQMLSDVSQADVVVVNPTHYAVALKWERAKRRAPVCVAKGADEIAARIRERAAEAGVPIHSDPPTARALYATLDIGQEIRHEQYRAVAAAIRFAEAMRKRAKAARR